MHTFVLELFTEAICKGDRETTPSMHILDPNTLVYSVVGQVTILPFSYAEDQPKQLFKPPPAGTKAEYPNVIVYLNHPLKYTHC